MRIQVVACLAVLCAALTGCGAAFPKPFDAAHAGVALVRETSTNADALRRAAAADSALHAVQLASDAQDAQALLAAAPCAVDALRAMAPDCVDQPALQQALLSAADVLARVGGTCVPL
jgi:hypothetical protein